MADTLKEAVERIRAEMADSLYRAIVVVMERGGRVVPVEGIAKFVRMCAKFDAGTGMVNFETEFALPGYKSWGENEKVPGFDSAIKAYEYFRDLLIDPDRDPMLVVAPVEFPLLVHPISLGSKTQYMLVEEAAEWLNEQARAFVAAGHKGLNYTGECSAAPKSEVADDDWSQGPQPPPSTSASRNAEALPHDGGE